jgi:hypothetical protein
MNAQLADDRFSIAQDLMVWSLFIIALRVAYLGLADLS